MAFPPEFSSTEMYENKYDLDELNVFIEGNSNNPMYFDVSGLPNKATYGKHYFNISILSSENQDHKLKQNSRILFEIKSINGVIIKSDVVKFNEKNGLITAYFEILRDPKRTYKSIYDGEAILTIVGSLENKPTTQNLIPMHFRNAMNYRCTYSINVRKNAVNGDSPIVANTSHLTQTFTGEFSFAKNVISSTSKDPNNGTKYGKNGFNQETIDQGKGSL